VLTKKSLIVGYFQLTKCAIYYHFHVISPTGVTFIDASSYIKNVWAKAILDAGLEHLVGYTTRYTGIAWHMLLRVDPERLISITGHADKGMIYGRYGRYRDGLYEEREEVLAYMGSDVLLADELNAFRAAGVREVDDKSPSTSRKTMILSPEIFSDNFSDKMCFYPDNYSQSSNG
jgi:hypothetical protein